MVSWRRRARRSDMVFHALGTATRYSGGGPRPEFRERLRSDLLAADRSGPEPSPVEPPRKPYRRLSVLRPVGIFASTLVLLLTMSLVTAQSIPGEPLYGLKRAAERTMVDLSTTDGERAYRELRSAKARAVEVRDLVMTRMEGRDQLIVVAFREMDLETRTAAAILRQAHLEQHDPVAIEALSTFAVEQEALLLPLLPDLPEDAREPANQYLRLIGGMTPPNPVEPPPPAKASARSGTGSASVPAAPQTSPKAGRNRWQRDGSEFSRHDFIPGWSAPRGADRLGSP
ncbi:DUF5667 domain-containing protein [Rhizohabitans arisaemae]|uniref:DUF5667 domain-containing protein n=1 Tax=Rhizohabitans arisaemae TaxID=2720610 RepID=UPI0024B1E2BC|nr:DUF5667 domain-containing protein [Rhizohabitans arisaemae]